MMSMIPSFFGNRRSSFFDPFSLDVWDPLKDLPFPSPSFPHGENSVFVNTRIDWKETPRSPCFQGRSSWPQKRGSEGSD
ncbi:hypothetical protein OIU84_008654 [Salix udensis]|uniref:Uncharacterized protein n=1 Tax=Salix udensis TaxID=889485 RepID=A0AAD6NY04_9ROSI|nr:hypothetical protein OIU84_008654 [Salix udensis]